MGHTRSNPSRTAAGLATMLALALLAACSTEQPRPDRPPDAAPARPDTASSPPAPPDRAATDSGPPDERAVADSAAAPWTVRDTRVDHPLAGAATLTAVRTAAHAGFDRIVLEFAADQLPGYRVAYIDKPVRQCGSGDVVPFPGDAWLSITVEPAYAHDDEGRATIADRARVLRLDNLLELQLICDFEAVVEWIAAVASPQPYRVFPLRDPARLVVDIQHK